MFHTIDTLKLNGFKQVILPSNKDLFSRLGKRNVSYVGSSDSLPMNLSKLDSLEYIDKLNREAQSEEDYARYVEEQKRLQSLENAEE